VPSALQEVINRAVSAEPLDRYQSMKDMSEALRRAIQTNRDRIRNFRFERHLAKGGFGNVYIASQMGEGDTILRKVVIKTITANLEDDKERTRNTYLKELQAMQFNHRNLITYHDTGVLESPMIPPEVEERILCGDSLSPSSLVAHDFTMCNREKHTNILLVWIAMEYSSAGSLEDESIRRFASNGQFEIDEVLDITDQILMAIDRLHSEGVIHRDLKPANILRFTDDDSWKVSDFGLVGITSDDGLVGSSSGFAGFGTPGWMAPEQRMGKVDLRADIYSVGQIMYYLLTGSEAFRLNVINPPPPSTQDRRISGSLSDIVVKCISYHPDGRYSEISQLRQELSQLKNGNGSQTASVEEPLSKSVADLSEDIGLDSELISPAREHTEEERLLLLMAQTRMREEDFVDAVTYFNRYLEARPEDPEAFYARGFAYSSLGEHLSAIEDYTEAIILDPEYADAYYARGAVYTTLQDRQKAQEDMSKGIRLRHGDDYADSLIKERDTGAPPEWFDEGSAI